MKYRIEITDLAARDLRDIRHYIADILKEPGVALAQIKRLRKAIEALEEWPLRHETVAEPTLATQGIRKCVVDNYIVFYCVEGERVFIVRVLYGKRNWVGLI